MDAEVVAALVASGFGLLVAIRTAHAQRALAVEVEARRGSTEASLAKSKAQSDRALEVVRSLQAKAVTTHRVEEEHFAEARAAFQAERRRLCIRLVSTASEFALATTDLVTWDGAKDSVPESEVVARLAAGAQRFQMCALESGVYLSGPTAVAIEEMRLQAKRLSEEARWNAANVGRFAEEYVAEIEAAHRSLLELLAAELQPVRLAKDGSA